MKKIFLPFLLAVAVSGYSQKVSNKLSFQKGQKLEVTTNMNMHTEMAMGETTASAVNTEVFDVKDVMGPATTLEKSMKSMKINFSLMGQEKKFDSDNKDDLNSDMGTSLKKVLDARQEFTVDASGKITAVKADPGKTKKEDAGGDMMGMLMSQINMGSEVPKEGKASFFKILPDYEVGKGDTWTDTAGSVKGNPVQTTYTVKDVSATEVVLDFTSDGKINTTQEMMGMSIQSKGTVKSSGTITLDKATGVLKQKMSTATTDTSTSVAGQEMASTAKITTVTTVKTL